MNKSTITREQLEEWVAQFEEDGGCDATDRQLEALIRQSLAAMDSEPVGSISIDRLLQLLYQFDGANECAASIGDQEYALECGDVASALRELLSCRSALPVADVVAWSNPNEERKCDIRWRRHDVEPGPLYLHAQQPLVPDDVLDALQKVARIRLDLNDFDGDRRGIADCLGDAEEALIEVVNRRAAMLQGAENTESRCGIQTAPALDSLPKNAESRCGNSPVIPEGWQVEAEKLAEMHGMSFVLFRNGDEPQCADPTKVVISFTDKGLGHDTLPAAPQEAQGE